ncbi:MAG: hypothetical protein ACODAE_10020 [Gemmatimonadota bacterium]
MSASDSDPPGACVERATLPARRAGRYLRCMGLNYDADDRVRLAEALRRGEAPSCPACGTPLARRAVDPRREVAYVRRRIWLICPGCKRSAAVDVRGDARP